MPQDAAWNDWRETWGKLPNAKYIMEMLGHATAYPHKWVHTRYTTARGIALEEVNKLVSPEMRDVARRETTFDLSMLDRGTASSLVHSTEDMFLALAAWDDCGYMFGLPLDAVRTLAGSGNHAAVLMLPGIIAMYGDNYAESNG